MMMLIPSDEICRNCMMHRFASWPAAGVHAVVYLFSTGCLQNLEKRGIHFFEYPEMEKSGKIE